MKDTVRIVNNEEQAKIEKLIREQPVLTQEELQKQIDCLNKVREESGLPPINIKNPEGLTVGTIESPTLDGEAGFIVDTEDVVGKVGTYHCDPGPGPALNKQTETVLGDDDFSIAFDAYSAPSASKVSVEDDLGFIDTAKADELAEVIDDMTDEDVKNTNVVDEHDPKYNIHKEDLAEANKRMLEGFGANVASDVSPVGDIVIKNGSKMHRRTARQYSAIWGAFCKDAAKEFKEIMGYSVKAIKKIGYKKFIDAMDWRSADDIFKFKTDKWHVVICPACSQEFGIYEQDVGLCVKCKEKHDMDLFWADYNKAYKENPAGAVVYTDMFFTSPTFRDRYRKVTIEELIKKADAEHFSGSNTFQLGMNLLAGAIQEAGPGEEGFKLFNEALKYYIVDFQATRIRNKMEAVKFVAMILGGASADNDWKNIVNKNILSLLKTED